MSEEYQMTFTKEDELYERLEKLEKENAELSNSVLELSNSVIELTNSETELEKQIKKMKCCGNCKGYLFCKRTYSSKPCFKWELAE